jgi:hypothetical protein
MGFVKAGAGEVMKASSRCGAQTRTSRHRACELPLSGSYQAITLIWIGYLSISTDYEVLKPHFHPPKWPYKPIKILSIQTGISLPSSLRPVF